MSLALLSDARVPRMYPPWEPVFSEASLISYGLAVPSLASAGEGLPSASSLAHMGEALVAFDFDDGLGDLCFAFSS